MIVEQSLDLARSPQTVYAYLVDQETWAAMDPALQDVSPQGPVVIGMAGTMTRRVGGRRVVNSWSVTNLEPGAKIEMRVTGVGYALTETTSLTATTAGTHAVIVELLEPTSLAGRLFVALSGPIVRRDLRARATRLKAAIDSLPVDSA